MFVVLSQFVIANDMVEDVRAAFRERPKLVDKETGFIRLEVISPVDQPESIWLLTYWTDKESFQVWHRSHLYKESHAGLPKGLKLVPGQNRIIHFDHIAS